MNSWRLVRTPNPAGGPDAVAAMRTAESARSDLDFAGLMLRCGEVEPEVLVVLVRPLPIHSHPNIAIEADGSSVDLIATVVPPGVPRFIAAGSCRAREGLVAAQCRSQDDRC